MNIIIKLHRYMLENKIKYRVSFARSGVLDAGAGQLQHSVQSAQALGTGKLEEHDREPRYGVQSEI